MHFPEKSATRALGYLSLLCAALLLAGCPEKSSETATTDPSAQSSTAESADASQNADQPRDSSGEPAADSAAEPPADNRRQYEAPENPQPSGELWVWPQENSFNVGEKVVFQHSGLAADGKSLVAMIRAEIDPKVWTADQLLKESVYGPQAADKGQGSVTALDEGMWRLVAFSDRADTQSIVYESNLIAVNEWPRGHNDANAEPPYITINPPGEEEVALNVGVGVAAYYELAEAYPKGAFIALVPAAVDNPIVLYGKQQALSTQPLSGALMDDPMFVLDTPGRYVIRIYPADLPGCEWSLESEPFSVVEPPK